MDGGRADDLAYAMTFVGDALAEVEAAAKPKRGKQRSLVRCPVGRQRLQNRYTRVAAA
jgi:hypothetical protein